jgi:hypothetical protein
MFAGGLPVNDEHAIIAVVRDSILLDNIAQGKYVCDGLFVKPYIAMITSHFALCLTVIDPPLLFSFIAVLDLKTFFTRFGLQIRSMVDWLSKRMISLRSSVTLLPCACLNSWAILGSKLSFHLCELEYVSGGLEVRLPLGGVRLRDVGIVFGLLELRERFLHALYFLLQFLDTFCLAGARFRVVLVVTIRAVCRWMPRLSKLEACLVVPILFIEIVCLTRGGVFSFGFIVFPFPPFCANDDSSDWLAFEKVVLLYLSSKCRVC